MFTLKAGYTADTEVIIVEMPRRGILACPMMRILMEYRAIMVRIPAKIPGISSLVCKKPVMKPQTMPAASANKRERKGFIPWEIKIAVTAPPVAKLPSTVRSAKSSTLKVM